MKAHFFSSIRRWSSNIPAKRIATIWNYVIQLRASERVRRPHFRSFKLELFSAFFLSICWRSAYQVNLSLETVANVAPIGIKETSQVTNISANGQSCVRAPLLSHVHCMGVCFGDKNATLHEKTANKRHKIHVVSTSGLLTVLCVRFPLIDIVIMPHFLLSQRSLESFAHTLIHGTAQA